MNGIINLYKEKDISSFKQIRKLKDIFGKIKIGHTGTLDPIAQGVLVVCLGKTTRLAEYIQAADKVYRVKMILGLKTNSYDISGEIENLENSDFIDDKDIKEVIMSFLGKQMQKPPIFSAKKVKGKRLYKYALENKEVEIKKSPIEIFDINNISIEKGSFELYSVKTIKMDVYCSKGTYIRSLCHDIGLKLKTYGTMSELTRLSVGNFDLKDSLKVEDVKKHYDNSDLDSIFIPLEEIFDFDEIVLNDRDLLRFVNGIKIECTKKDGEYFIKDEKNNIISLSIVTKGIIKNKVMLKDR